jgi:hypothetical protein
LALAGNEQQWRYKKWISLKASLSKLGAAAYGFGLWAESWPPGRARHSSEKTANSREYHVEGGGRAAGSCSNPAEKEDEVARPDQAGPRRIGQLAPSYRAPKPEKKTSVCRPTSMRTWKKESRTSVDVVHTGLSLFNETDKWVPSWSTECSLDGAAQWQWGSSLSLPVAREWGAARQKEEEAAENISRSQK